MPFNATQASCVYCRPHLDRPECGKREWPCSSSSKVPTIRADVIPRLPIFIEPRRAHLEYKTAFSLAVGIGERCAHGVDRNRRYDAREKESKDANSDRKYARERLPRYDITITNRQAGDEGEIQCVPNRPAF